MILKAIFA